MQRSTKSTSRLRVVVALVFAFAFPGFLLGEAYYWLDTPLVREQNTVGLGLAGMVFGVFLGWPFVLGAACVWALLDGVDRHYAWSAALVGVFARLAVAAFAFHDGRIHAHPIAYPLCGAIGLTTGLGVWWIAYGRQGWLRAPAPPPRTRLVL